MSNLNNTLKPIPPNCKVETISRPPDNSDKQLNRTLPKLPILSTKLPQTTTIKNSNVRATPTLPSKCIISKHGPGPRPKPAVAMLVTPRSPLKLNSTIRPTTAPAPSTAPSHLVKDLTVNRLNLNSNSRGISKLHKEKLSAQAQIPRIVEAPSTAHERPLSRPRPHSQGSYQQIFQRQSNSILQPKTSIEKTNNAKLENHALTEINSVNFEKLRELAPEETDLPTNRNPSHLNCGQGDTDVVPLSAHAPPPPADSAPAPTFLVDNAQNPSQKLDRQSTAIPHAQTPRFEISTPSKPNLINNNHNNNVLNGRNFKSSSACASTVSSRAKERMLKSTTAQAQPQQFPRKEATFNVSQNQQNKLAPAQRKETNRAVCKTLSIAVPVTAEPKIQIEPPIPTPSNDNDAVLPQTSADALSEKDVDANWLILQALNDEANSIQTMLENGEVSEEILLQLLSANHEIESPLKLNLATNPEIIQGLLQLSNSKNENQLSTSEPESEQELESQSIDEPQLQPREIYNLNSINFLGETAAIIPQHFLNSQSQIGKNVNTYTNANTCSIVDFEMNRIFPRAPFMYNYQVHDKDITLQILQNLIQKNASSNNSELQRYVDTLSPAQISSMQNRLHQLLSVSASNPSRYKIEPELGFLGKGHFTMLTITTDYMSLDGTGEDQPIIKNDMFTIETFTVSKKAAVLPLDRIKRLWQNVKTSAIKTTHAQLTLLRRPQIDSDSAPITANLDRDPPLATSGAQNELESLQRFKTVDSACAQQKQPQQKQKEQQPQQQRMYFKSNEDIIRHILHFSAEPSLKNTKNAHALNSTLAQSSVTTTALESSNSDFDNSSKTIATGATGDSEFKQVTCARPIGCPAQMRMCNKPTMFSTLLKACTTFSGLMFLAYSIRRQLQN